ncbi:uncharacterized protein CLUP02_00588 [Colletotrichum lupini]|uniref:Uncharacterized protein n=1 Tax=Colletotrichum lupini TaxID=145971 RepID=A0A9Q8W8H0_9PEZI|nr:uncharacterized protein CLUP02_00588 [Colletotrichum lupini]UQC73941.1 hypothetical protein CLUP02_00588 [Colletotrichum lupini]
MALLPPHSDPSTIYPAEGRGQRSHEMWQIDCRIATCDVVNIHNVVVVAGCLNPEYHPGVEWWFVPPYHISLRESLMGIADGIENLGVNRRYNSAICKTSDGSCSDGVSINKGAPDVAVLDERAERDFFRCGAWAGVTLNRVWLFLLRVSLSFDSLSCSVVSAVQVGLSYQRQHPLNGIDSWQKHWRVTFGPDSVIRPTFAKLAKSATTCISPGPSPRPQPLTGHHRQILTFGVGAPLTHRIPQRISELLLATSTLGGYKRLWCVNDDALKFLHMHRPTYQE